MQNRTEGDTLEKRREAIMIIAVPIKVNICMEIVIELYNTTWRFGSGFKNTCSNVLKHETLAKQSFSSSSIDLYIHNISMSILLEIVRIRREIPLTSHNWQETL